eukprot:1202592-Alexandrium_andersonii.AAC.1
MEKAEVPAWFVDGDCVWLRPAAWAVEALPAEAFGHFFGTAARRSTGPGLTAEAYERQCFLYYLAKPRDAL